MAAPRNTPRKHPLSVQRRRQRHYGCRYGARAYIYERRCLRRQSSGCARLFHSGARFHEMLKEIRKMMKKTRKFYAALLFKQRSRRTRCYFESFLVIFRGVSADFCIFLSFRRCTSKVTATALTEVILCDQIDNRNEQRSFFLIPTTQPRAAVLFRKFFGIFSWCFGRFFHFLLRFLRCAQQQK